VPPGIRRKLGVLLAVPASKALEPHPHSGAMGAFLCQGYSGSFSYRSMPRVYGAWSRPAPLRGTMASRAVR
jgi:hypothetical protein